MNASKENCAKAMRIVKNARFKYSPQVLHFLEAAHRKLPSEAAYEKAKAVSDPSKL